MRLLIIIFFLTTSKTCLCQDSTNKIYYPSGQLKSFQIKKDSQNIYEKDFYENGKVSGEGFGSFTNGKYNAKNYKRYYETGILKATFTDTLLEAFEEDGRIYMHVEMENGIKNGEFRSYLVNKLSMIMHYKNGKKDGVSKSFNIKTGKVSMEENFKNGLQTGPARHYDENGKLTKEIFYEGDCPVKAIYYDKSSKPIKTVTDKMKLKLNEGVSFNCK